MSGIVNVRYLVHDVAECVDFYTHHFGFTVGISSPAFADVTRGNLRLLLSGPMSSAGQAMGDGDQPAEAVAVPQQRPQPRQQTEDDPGALHAGQYPPVPEVWDEFTGVFS